MTSSLLRKYQLSRTILETHSPPNGYVLKFSGGKDSIVCYQLLVDAGVPFRAEYNRTGIDPPEAVYFIRNNYADVLWVVPKVNMWNGILRHGLPTRFQRWCCRSLKESDEVSGTTVVLGLRAAESARRRDRCFTETSRTDSSVTLINPILQWTDDDVWEFIRGRGLSYCSLYDTGFKRVGCILCPMLSQKQTLMQAERYPKFVLAWFLAADRYYDRARQRGLRVSIRFPSAEEYFIHWTSRMAVVTPEFRARIGPILLRAGVPHE